MEFWALAYKHKEGNFYDFKLKGIETHLKESCLLPTKEIAEKHIEELSDDYIAVQITIHSYSAEGSKLGYSMTKLSEWY